MQGGKGKLLRPVTSGNIAAVEPYHHVPVNSSGRTVTSGDPDKQPDAGGGSYGGQKQPAHSRPTAGDGIAHLGKEGVRLAFPTLVILCPYFAQYMN